MLLKVMNQNEYLVTDELHKMDEILRFLPKQNLLYVVDTDSCLQGEYEVKYCYKR